MPRQFVLSVLIVVLSSTTARVFGFQACADCRAEASSLMRKELPDDFPFQVFDAGFAVVRLRFENSSEAPVQVNPQEMEFFSPKKKRLDTADPTEIAPRIIKYYHGSGSIPVHGDVSYGYPYPPNPTVAHTGRRPGVGTGTGAGKLDAGTGPALRGILDHYQFKPITVAPGEQIEGLIYLKSKQSGNALSGGWIIVDGRKVDF